MSSKLALPRGRSLQLYLLIILLISNAVSAFRIGSVPRLTTQLNAVKASSNDKIRVKLLADVKGTGRYGSSIFLPIVNKRILSHSEIPLLRKGEILFISPAMWTNVMAPKKLAQKMSDEEVANTAAQTAAVQAEDLAKARKLEELINNMQRYVIPRKVGAGKNLFGSVSHKELLGMLKERFPENVTAPTSIIITDMKGENNCLVDASLLLAPLTLSGHLLFSRVLTPPHIRLMSEFIQ